MTNGWAAADRRTAPDNTEAAFKQWLRRLVTGAAELAAFDAGQVDAVMDRGSGSAVLLPEAQVALQSSSRMLLSALDALPGEVCVLDSTGTVVMANKAWHAFSLARGGAGLDVREGGNFFAACGAVPESERPGADEVAAGLRQVLTGIRQTLRCRYVCHAGRPRHVFTLTIAAMVGAVPVSAVVTREWESRPNHARHPRYPAPRTPSRGAAAAHTGGENHLLASLPPRDHARMAPGLEPVLLTYGEVLYEPGQAMQHVYFPSTSVVSLLTLVEGHHALEVGQIGREGMIGARLALGAVTSSARALVQGTGAALRMTSQRFLEEFRRSATLQRLLYRFTDNLMIQISQTAACNRFHIVEARLARWLLMTAERMASAEIHLTHEFLADMLGVRREGVTLAASALQRRELIHYRRGRIKILDMRGLQATACSCYRDLQTPTES